MHAAPYKSRRILNLLLESPNGQFGENLKLLLLYQTL